MTIPDFVFTRPCLRWRALTGDPIHLSLLDMLAKSHTLDTVGDETPQTTFATIRFLLSVMHRFLPYPDLAARQKVWKRKRFDGDFLQTVADYAKARKENLLTFTDTGSTIVSTLCNEIPSGSNINHPNHAYDDTMALCLDCCLKIILRIPPFYISCGRASDGSYPKSSINGGFPPCYHLPIGDNLFETLVLNWPLAQPVKGDYPSWETIKTKRPSSVSLLEGLTYQSIHVSFRVEKEWKCPCYLCGSSKELVHKILTAANKETLTEERTEGWRDPHIAYKKREGTGMTWKYKTRPSIPDLSLCDIDAISVAKALTSAPLIILQFAILVPSQAKINGESMRVFPT